jgi:hypothetical protein
MGAAARSAPIAANQDGGKRQSAQSACLWFEFFAWQAFTPEAFRNSTETA